jgi:beta-galactosidase
MAQVAKAYRNHPSVIFYQVENELVYINGMNIYGGYLDRVEELMSEVCEAGRALDPTRPYTVGGGGDLSGRLEINSPHYPHTAFDYYPENAYTIDHYAEKIKRWPWDRGKPWVVGESCFANELAFGAYVAGDDVFRGADAAKRGKAKFLRMLYGGYRWAGVAGFFPWDNLWDYEDARKVFSDLYVVPRKQTTRLFAGRRNELLVKVMNDTLSDAPVMLEWSYAVEGRTAAADTVEIKIEPGLGKEHTVVIDAPQTGKRLEGLLTVKASQGGAETYVDERMVPVLPHVTSLRSDATIHVLDRRGALTQFLRKAGLPFRRVESLDELKNASGLLLLGHDTLTPDEAFGPRLLGFAALGGSVVVLEQENAPAGAALPTPAKPTSHFGGYAHPQALGTPLFRDLRGNDLIDWAGSHPTYKNVYLKPAQGGRSLAECGGSLEFSPLIEVPCGAGVMVLCQLRVAEKLGVDPAADVLLRNLINVYARYEPSAGKVALVASGDSLLSQTVHNSGALAEKAAHIDEALDAGRFRVALIPATEQNLQVLLQKRAKVEAFQQTGGWLMLTGLAPEGIDEFNKLVEADYMLRPFRVERVTLENPDYALAATLGNRDVALQSPQGIMHGRYWVSGNTFSYVIDNKDFAPFTQPPEGPEDPYEYQPTFDDHDPFNYVNGMISSDFWRYIRQIWVPESGTVPLTFKLRRPDAVKTIKIWNNENYWTIEELGVYFDGNRSDSVRVTLPDSSDLTTVELPEPVRVNESITLEILSWRERPLDRKELRLVGIDNVQFLRPESREKAVFLDNVGGLVAFPKGKGGTFLCQLKFMADEPRPENADKKLRILSVVLQNMGVGSRSASKVAVPGVNVRFTPVNIQEYCNAYLAGRGERAGWFGDRDRDMKMLPRGRAEFADVAYRVVDYLTAPIPDCIILGGKRAHPGSIRDKASSIAGIKVGRKADILYSLHTAHVARPITDRERRQILDRRRPFVRPTVFEYILHYTDGTTAEIPVILEQHIDHWLSDDPKPLEGARIGWARPIAPDAAERAVLYSMQAANPRPDVEIRSIEIARTDNRATPAIVALTLGEIVGRQ